MAPPATAMVTTSSRAATRRESQPREAEANPCDRIDGAAALLPSGPGPVIWRQSSNRSCRVLAVRRPTPGMAGRVSGRTPARSLVCTPRPSATALTEPSFHAIRLVLPSRCPVVRATALTASRRRRRSKRDGPRHTVMLLRWPIVWLPCSRVRVTTNRLTVVSTIAVRAHPIASPLPRIRQSQSGGCRFFHYSGITPQEGSRSVRGVSGPFRTLRSPRQGCGSGPPDHHPLRSSPSTSRVPSRCPGERDPLPVGRPLRLALRGSIRGQPPESVPSDPVLKDCYRLTGGKSGSTWLRNAGSASP